MIPLQKFMKVFINGAVVVFQRLISSPIFGTHEAGAKGSGPGEKGSDAPQIVPASYAEALAIFFRHSNQQKGTISVLEIIPSFRNTGAVTNPCGSLPGSSERQ